MYEEEGQYIFKANLAGIDGSRSHLDAVTRQHEIDEKLAREGFDLVFAADGHIGLKHYSNGRDFDLVITDFVHPGPDGLELAKRIRSENPNQAIAVVTGGINDEIEEALMNLKVPVFSRVGVSGWYRKIVDDAIDLNHKRLTDS
jgi:CheY-like chemotaxis protein